MAEARCDAWVSTNVHFFSLSTFIIQFLDTLAHFSPTTVPFRSIRPSPVPPDFFWHRIRTVQIFSDFQGFLEKSQIPNCGRIDRNGTVYPLDLLGRNTAEYMLRSQTSSHCRSALDDKSWMSAVTHFSAWNQRCHIFDIFKAPPNNEEVRLNRLIYQHFSSDISTNFL